MRVSAKVDYAVRAAVERSAAAGFTLRERLAIYPEFAARPEFVSGGVAPYLESQRGEDNFAKAQAERSRKFGAPEGDDGIVRCDACPVLCRIRPGRVRRGCRLAGSAEHGAHDKARAAHVKVTTR